MKAKQMISVGKASVMVVLALWAIRLPGRGAQAQALPGQGGASAAQASPLLAPHGTILLVNGDFESGPGVGWTASSDYGRPLIYPASQLPATVTPHGGNWAAWLGRDDESSLTQDVDVPANAPILSFWYWIAAAEPDCGWADWAEVRINNTNVWLRELCTPQNTGGWEEEQQVALDAYAGQTVSLQFYVDSWSADDSFFLDDVTLTGANQSPVAMDDSATTVINTPVTIDVAANDYDVDGNLDPASATQVSGPSHGAVTNNLNGTFTYAPATDYVGSDSFVYQICDTAGLCDTATVALTITNDPPVAADDSALTTANTPRKIDVLANDRDPDGNLDPASASLVSGPSHGSVDNHHDGTFTYTPDLDYAGQDSFVYQVCDTAGLCDTATVTIIVTSTPLLQVYLPFVARNLHSGPSNFGVGRR